ncbi:MAG: ABC transporter ATP-binding protein [Erysipelotrichaceae bacterium]|nr:ABC transporter ATP-binding protein [Erysipelotrichaceae bacterium]
MSPIVRLSSVSFSYPGSKRKILDDCSFSIEKGEIVSILGPNGSGKSTLLNCACNLLTPQSGLVYLNDIPISSMTIQNVAKVIGYVQQYQESAFAYSVFDYVLMGRANRIEMFRKPDSNDFRIVENVLEKMRITHLSDRPITEISGGERQQAAIARAIAQEPQVIFFDEPTAHLDFGNQISTLKLIASLKNEGYAIVMTTHNPDHSILLGGKTVILNKEGHLEIYDASQIAKAELLSNIYNTDLLVPFVKEAERFVCIPKSL